MPHIKHVTEIDYIPTFRSEKVAGMFNLDVKDKLRREWDIGLPIEKKEWTIGLIVGASGTGKTTIARQAFGDRLHNAFTWDEKCFLDDFSKNLEVREIVETLSKVGFSSPPSWLLPYNALSNGQKFRAEIARCLLEYDGLLVYDEFTSFVDRTAAQIGCHAIQKYVRKRGGQFVGVTCHYDVEGWLQPDWVLDMSTQQFKWGFLRRDKINIQVFRCDHKAWRLFRGHHYLSADANKSAIYYVAFIFGEPVAMVAVIPFPHPTIRRAWREHRVVVLPDYQGIGIGNRLSDFVGDIMIRENKKYFSTTSHPSLVNSRVRSPRWSMIRKPSRILQSATTMRGMASSCNRLSASFRYLGGLPQEAIPFDKNQ